MVVTRGMSVRFSHLNVSQVSHTDNFRMCYGYSDSLVVSVLD